MNGHTTTCCNLKAWCAWRVARSAEGSTALSQEKTESRVTCVLGPAKVRFCVISSTGAPEGSSSTELNMFIVDEVAAATHCAHFLGLIPEQLYYGAHSL